MKFSASVASMFFLLSAVLAHGAGTADGYREECEKELAEANAIFQSLEKLEGPKTIETVLVPLNELEVVLSKTASKASLFYNVHPSQEVRHRREPADGADQTLQRYQSFAPAIRSVQGG